MADISLIEAETWLRNCIRDIEAKGITPIEVIRLLHKLEGEEINSESWLQAKDYEQRPV